MTTLRARVDASLTASRAVLAARQAAHHAAHGRYWSGPLNPPAVPVDGDVSARMRVDLKHGPVERRGTVLAAPSAESWGDMNFGAALPDGAGFSIAVVGGRDGYMILARMRLDGEVYQRRIHEGARVEDVDWKQMKRRP
jgi:hypothetical protein